MFDELITNLSTTLAVVSLLFFVVVYLVVVTRLLRTSRHDLDAHARLVLDDGEAHGVDAAVRG